MQAHSCQQLNSNNHVNQSRSPGASYGHHTLPLPASLSKPSENLQVVAVASKSSLAKGYLLMNT